MRDFTHVKDIARACELTAGRELTGVYNVGIQKAYSFNEMVELINDALGTDVEPAYIKRSFGGYVHDTMAGYSTFRDAIGWEPKRLVALLVDHLTAHCDEGFDDAAIAVLGLAVKPGTDDMQNSRSSTTSRSVGRQSPPTTRSRPTTRPTTSTT